MTATRSAHIFFSTLHDALDRPALQWWLAYRDDLLGRRPDPLIQADRSAVTPRLFQLPRPEGDGGVIWRLFTEGQREIGCSAEVFPDFEAAAANAATAKDLAQRLRQRTFTRAEPAAYAWALTRFGRPVLLTSLWRATEAERDQSLIDARQALRDASIAESLGDRRHGHRQRTMEPPMLRQHQALPEPVERPLKLAPAKPPIIEHLSKSRYPEHAHRRPRP